MESTYYATIFCYLYFVLNLYNAMALCSFLSTNGVCLIFIFIVCNVLLKLKAREFNIIYLITGTLHLFSRFYMYSFVLFYTFSILYFFYSILLFYIHTFNLYLCFYFIFILLIYVYTFIMLLYLLFHPYSK